MSEIKIIEGGIFTDSRGRISHVNDLDMSEVARFYAIHMQFITVTLPWFVPGMHIRRKRNGFMC